MKLVFVQAGVVVAAPILHPLGRVLEQLREILRYIRILQRLIAEGFTTQASRIRARNLADYDLHAWSIRTQRRHAQQQNFSLRPEGQQRSAKHRATLKNKGRVLENGEELVKISLLVALAGGRKIDLSPLNAPVSYHLQRQFDPGAILEGGAKDFVACDNGLDCRLQYGLVETSLNQDCTLDPIGDALDPVDLRPQPFLLRRKPKSFSNDRLHVLPSCQSKTAPSFPPELFLARS